jgi:hypothetical protein
MISFPFLVEGEPYYNFHHLPLVGEADASSVDSAFGSLSLRLVVPNKFAIVFFALLAGDGLLGI